jgi:hypothetical protein
LNDFGIVVDAGSDGNTIGSLRVAAMNIIGGNTSRDGRSGAGVELASNDNIVLGNHIGPENDVAGYGANRVGVRVGPVAKRNQIGGAGANVGGNLISGNAEHGIEIRGEQTTVEDNRIGTDELGEARLGNGGAGILVAGPHSIISDNVISANKIGVQIKASDTEVNNNLIGTNARRTASLGNAEDGIVIQGSRNLIGNRSGNRIAFNGFNGIRIDRPTSTFNWIVGNAIFRNGRLGISMAPGANGGIQPPTLTEATWDETAQRTNVDGTFRGQPNTSHTIEFFRNSACDRSGSGEGQEPVATFGIRTDDLGSASFLVHFTAAHGRPGWIITATATQNVRPTEPFLRNTSAFSRCIPVR